MRRPVWVPDNYILMLVGTVVLATLLPASGDLAVVLRHVTTVAIGLLFFLHGAKLSREAIVAGLMHWRLYLAVFACTFVLFPILGLVLRPVLEPLVNPELYLGILFLCFLPSTVQSAIALTSMARGNIPAAICCASGSTLLGVFVTPFFVGLWVSPQAAEMSAWSSIARIFMQLMLPFLVG
ncbi:MAG: bile acid:sodium symporter, partial [Pigmentiphaga sp.]